MAFQAKEMETSSLAIGEEETLKEERRILSHAQKLIEFSDSSQEMLYGGEGSAIERIQRILNQGREAISIDPSLSQVLKNLETASIQLEEVALALRDYSRRTDINPMRLEEIEGRFEEILGFKDRVDEMLKSFASDEERLFQLERVLPSLQEAAGSLAQRLSRTR